MTLPDSYPFVRSDVDGEILERHLPDMGFVGIKVLDGSKPAKTVVTFYEAPELESVTVNLTDISSEYLRKALENPADFRLLALKAADIHVKNAKTVNHEEMKHLMDPTLFLQ